MQGEARLPGDELLVFPALPVARHPGLCAPWLSVPGPWSSLCSRLTAYSTVTAHIGCALVIFRRGETCPHLNILEVCGEERDRLSVIFVQHDTSLLCERPDHNCVCVSARAVGNWLAVLFRMEVVWLGLWLSRDLWYSSNIPRGKPKSSDWREWSVFWEILVSSGWSSCWSVLWKIYCLRYWN